MSERNHEVIKSQQLLDEYGNIAEPGWSRKQLQQYSRTQIKAPKFRIKEWDYYLVVGDDCAVAFTLSDDGYVGLQSVSLLDFSGEPWEHTETILDAFPMGKLRMPENSSKKRMRACGFVWAASARARSGTSFPTPYSTSPMNTGRARGFRPTRS